MCGSSDPTDTTVRTYYKAKRDKQVFDIYAKKYEFCSNCDSYVEQNVKHCWDCNRCVNEFDHHCFWLNNCIGGQNIAWYWGMLISIEIFSIFQISLILFQLLQKNDNFSKVRYVNENGQKIMLWVGMGIDILIFMFMSHLLIRQIWLYSKGMTTYDYIKQVRKEKAQQELEKLQKLEQRRLEQMRLQQQQQSRIKSLQEEESEQFQPYIEKTKSSKEYKQSNNNLNSSNNTQTSNNNQINCNLNNNNNVNQSNGKFIDLQLKDNEDIEVRDSNNFSIKQQHSSNIQTQQVSSVRSSCKKQQSQLSSSRQNTNGKRKSGSVQFDLQENEEEQLKGIEEIQYQQNFQYNEKGSIDLQGIIDLQKKKIELMRAKSREFQSDLHDSQINLQKNKSFHKIMQFTLPIKTKQICKSVSQSLVSFDDASSRGGSIEIGFFSSQLQQQQYPQQYQSQNYGSSGKKINKQFVFNQSQQQQQQQQQSIQIPLLQKYKSQQQQQNQEISQDNSMEEREQRSQSCIEQGDNQKKNNTDNNK